MSQTKTQTIQGIYGAFARGDISFITEAFAPEGEISFNVAKPAAAWQRTAQGRPKLAVFFAALAENVEFSSFEPKEFVESSDSVIVRVHMKYRVKATGRMVEQTQVHWWSFDGARIRSIVHYEDTAQVAAAVG
jgi:hypothetical protein